MKQHQGVWLPDGEQHLIGWMDKAGELVDGRGSYQIKKLRTALEHCKQFRTAVDVGAHCGLWSMQLVKRFKHLVAFEPVKTHRDCYLANMNGHDNVELHGCGLGDRAGFVSIESKPDSSGDSRVAAFAEGMTDDPKAPRIPLKTLDSFELQDVDFIKIDTEGFELYVVRGAEQTIKRCRPTMIVEQKGHGMQYHGFRKEEAVELLESWGMKRVANMSGDIILVSAMMHSIVYYDPKMYAGWPANHGAWQWGDEFLVGFLRGPFKRKSMHNIVEPYERMLARSRDGGRTWHVEKPTLEFECVFAGQEMPQRFSLADCIVRVCGAYDHGGDNCQERGGFYLSSDRGSTWSGAFDFFGLEVPENHLNTSRTRVLGDLLFMSTGHAQFWGTDDTFVARHDGERFHRIGTVCDDDARAVMPAVAKVGQTMLCALRRRKSGVRSGWVDLFASEDGGVNWSKRSFVGETGSHNGNPPALIALNDGRILCAFGNRDDGSIRGAISVDIGKTWRSMLIRSSQSDNVDIGYPQLFKRSDGTPVCVYYWADNDRPQQHIVATEVGV